MLRNPSTPLALTTPTFAENFRFYYILSYCQRVGYSQAAYFKATSIEKILKIPASGRNFLDSLPPPLRKGPYRRKRRYFVPNRNYKIRFFRNFNPLSLISPESRTSPIFTIEVAPNPNMLGFLVRYSIN